MRPTVPLIKILPVCMLALVALVFVPRLFQEGVFIDGMTYASVARNMAEGIGAYWRPYYADAGSYWLPSTITEVYYDAPPLQYWLTIPLFWLLGDHWYTEKVYCGIVLVAYILAVIRLWIWVFPKQNHWYALPVVLLCMASQFRWGLANNLLDSTMAVFDLLAVGFLLQAVGTDRSKPVIEPLLWVVLAGASIFAAFLSKGPVGLYPLALPCIYAVVMRRISIRQGIGYTILAILIVGMFMGLLWLYAPARTFLTGYLNHQIFDSLAGKRAENNASAGTYGRFFIVVMLLQNLWLMALASGLGGILYLIAQKNAPALWLRYASLFLLVGLSATLPIMLSPKQAAHYLVVSLPLFALGFGIVLKFFTEGFLQKIVLPRIIFQLLVFVVIPLATIEGVFTLQNRGLMGTSDAEKKLIAEVKQIGKIVPVGAKMQVLDQATIQQAQVNNYLERYYKIQLTTQKQPQNLYALVIQQNLKSIPPVLLSEGFDKVALTTESFLVLSR